MSQAGEEVVETRFLIVGAGISGLSFADWVGSDDYVICEADSEIGGYCKTVEQDGFVWDYSGHFFHFRRPEIEKYLVDRMQGQQVLDVEKRSLIHWKGEHVDFPFQKNIHQLPKEDFAAASFKGRVVVLDTRVTDALKRTGLAREVVNRVQRARKDMDLPFEARIELRWETADEELATALGEHAAYVRDQVLAVSFDRSGEGQGERVDAEVEGHPLTLHIHPV